MLVEEWPAAGFEATLRERDRILVLYDADWCEHAVAFRPHFEAAEAEAVVPFARTSLRRILDPRWDRFGIRIVPTLVYYEHGEELERCDGVKGIGLTSRDLAEFLDLVASIQEEPLLPKRMHGIRRA